MAWVLPQDLHFTRSIFNFILPIGVLIDNPEITESDVRYTINKFKKDWKERIISIASIPILMFLKQDDLQEKVSKCFKRAFMQIKSCFYQLF
jgi:hypothetical protein